MSIRFQWNPPKATVNARKHGVTFVEAATVFQDALACIFADEDHSEDEHREIIVGHSNCSRLLAVSFTEPNDVIRIISAPKADHDEREDYKKSEAMK